MVARKGQSDLKKNKKWFETTNVRTEYCYYTIIPLVILVFFSCRYRDLYHTCYTLSGLSVAQHSPLLEKHVVGASSNVLVSFTI